jgi:hypothetical protein
MGAIDKGTGQTEAGRSSPAERLESEEDADRKKAEASERLDELHEDAERAAEAARKQGSVSEDL